MPSRFSAYLRHFNFYLPLAAQAADLFAEDRSQMKGLHIFDENQPQIDAALEWLQQQKETHERDLVLVSFIDAISGIGLVRFHVENRLLPLMQVRIDAAQRLEDKVIQADAYDDLGIAYAYLGYLEQSIANFQIARSIASEVGDGTILEDIENHLRQAESQFSGRNRISSGVPGLIRLVKLQIRLFLSYFRGTSLVEITILNDLADIYIEWGMLDAAARLLQRANLLSAEHSFRLGEIQSSLGLLHIELIREGNVAELAAILKMGTKSDGFEVSNNLYFFETLLEILPALETAELMAQSLSMNNQNEPAKEIYELLDEILAQMTLVQIAVQERDSNKGEIMIKSLTTIKECLARVISLYSNREA